MPFVLGLPTETGWITQPWVLFIMRASPREDVPLSSSEAIYGLQLVLP